MWANALYTRCNLDKQSHQRFILSPHYVRPIGHILSDNMANRIILSQIMSRTIIRSRVENNSSLGSRFDWFVIERGYSTDSKVESKVTPNQIKLNPSVKARVHDPEAAAALCRHYQHDAFNKNLPLDYIFLSYNETQELFESNGWRVRSFDDTFSQYRASYVVRFRRLGDITVTASNERQAIARAQERIGSRGIVNADTLDSAWIVLESELDPE